METARRTNYLVRAALAALTLALATSGLARAAGSAEHFKGTTSQKGYRLTFDVVGSRVENATIGWKARCLSHQYYSRATRESTTHITIRNGRWSSSGSYKDPIAGAPRLTGRYEVLEFRGRLTSTRRATGAFHLKVLIYNKKHHVDTCDTGKITWNATLS